MKLLFSLLALLFAGCFGTSGAGYGYSSPSASIGIDTFDPYLDPYGAWMDVPGYGRSWQPSPQYVGSDFYPYGTGGRWVSTNAGWVFDTDYPFGWAVFHYGRWYRDDNYGWLWTPGSRWAPSWVTWRGGGSYVGWAPLGPSGRLRWDDWCFVPANRFTQHNVSAYGLRDRNYFHRAVEATEPLRGGRGGPPPTWISRATRREIVPVPVNQVPSAGRFVPPPPPPGSYQRRTRTAPPTGRYDVPPAVRSQQPYQQQQREPGGFMAPPPPPSSSQPQQPQFQRRSGGESRGTLPPSPPPPSSSSSPAYEQPAAPPPIRPQQQGGYMGAPPPPPPPSSSSPSRPGPSMRRSGGPTMMPPPPPPPPRR